MQLTNYLVPDHLLMQVSVNDKYELLDRMVEAVCKSELMERSGLELDPARQAVRTREEERSTALGGGVALPHARLPGFKGLGLAVATLEKPLDFGDGELVSIVCLVLAPQERPTVCLKVMSQLTRFFSTAREEFAAITDPWAAWKLLQESNLSIDIPVYARDIMEKPGLSVPKDMSLTEVTRLMFTNHLETVPVVDGEGKICGEITCNRLFRFGLPDFFRQLKSVSFISEFDPFEKYFAEESRACARDLMLAETAMRQPDSTLLEIVFDLAVKRYPQVYITDSSGRWVGSINRITVLNNVISF
ncbi:MAG: PTS sugar transporter subunit IIA [Kiritimatiellales bacterium]